MVRIKCIDRNELIEKLTASKGEVDSNVFLISITDTDKTPIISPSGRKNILSFTAKADIWGFDLFTYDDVIAVYKFIKSIPLTTDITLVIQSEAGVGRAGAVACFAMEILPNNYIDYPFFWDNNLNIEPNRIALKKLYLVKDIVEAKSEFSSLPETAYLLLESKFSSPELKAAASEYLTGLFTFQTGLAKTLNFREFHRDNIGS